MSKNQIERKHLKKNMMKNIIFRIDYQGILDSEDIAKLFKDNFKGYFTHFETTFHNKVDFDLNNIADISDTLSIPIREIEKQEIYRFTKNNFGSDELIFDISKYFTVLNVNCTNYQGIDDYLTFFANYMDFLYKNNDFVKIKRIGLRKIGGKIYFNIGDIYKDFEQKYFNFDFTDTIYNTIRNRYEDVLKYDDVSPIINYIRSFESGIYLDAETNDKKVAYQVLLDIDGYYSEEILENIDFKEGMAQKVLELTNHEHLFNIFKMSVTNEYLNANKNE